MVCRWIRCLTAKSASLSQGPLCLPLRPSSLWMIQRALDACEGLDEPGQASVRDWLARAGGAQMPEPDLPRLQRLALHVAPVAGVAGADGYDTERSVMPACAQPTGPEQDSGPRMPLQEKADVR